MILMQDDTKSDDVEDCSKVGGFLSLGSLNDYSSPNSALASVHDQGPRVSGPTRRSTRGGWTTEEDELLTTAVREYRGKNWKKIAERLPHRSDVQCLHRWQKVLDPSLIKGPWKKEEDELILKLVGQFGITKWSDIARHLPGRIGKQCRERWHNHLNPSINKSPWTQWEEAVLIKAHQEYGNKWAEIAKLLNGRTENAIKNHWNCSLKKRLDASVVQVSDSFPYKFKAGVQTLPVDSKQGSNSDHQASFSLELTLGSSSNTEADSHSTALVRRETNRAARPLFDTPSFEKKRDAGLPFVPRNGSWTYVGNNAASLCHDPEPKQEAEVRPIEDRLSSTSNSFLGITSSKASECTPPRNERTGLSSTSDSPESILKNRAKSFSSTPSIIRKRLNRTSSNSNSVTSSDSRDALTLLKAKQLFSSPPNFQKFGNCSPLAESIEKRLEPSFDAAWDGPMKFH